MFELRFVETEYGSYHPAQGTYIEGFKILQIDPERTAGNSYFELESRKCKIEFYSNNWIDNNILVFTNFQNTVYHNYCFQIIKDDELYYTGYIKKEDIYKTKQTNMVQIYGTDIIGVLLRLSAIKKEYEIDYNEIIPVSLDNGILPDEIEDILTNFNVDVLVDYSGYPGLDLSEARISYDHENDFLDVSGTDGFTGSGTLYRRRIREITWDSDENKFRVLLIDYKSENHGTYWTSNFIYLRFYLSTNGDITDMYFRNRTSQTELNYYDYWTQNGGDSYSNVYSATYQGWTILIEGRKLYYTGNLGLIGITIKPENDDDTTRSISRKDIITKCLKLINGYLYITQNTITIKNRYPLDTTEYLIIDNGIKKFNSSGFSYLLDFVNEFNMFQNSDYLEYVMGLFYQNLFSVFNNEYDVEIDSTINTITIENILFIDGKYMQVIEILEEPKSGIYIIKAWGE